MCWKSDFIFFYIPTVCCTDVSTSICAQCVVNGLKKYAFVGWGMSCFLVIFNSNFQWPEKCHRKQKRDKSAKISVRKSCIAVNEKGSWFRSSISFRYLRIMGGFKFFFIFSEEYSELGKEEMKMKDSKGLKFMDSIN